ncbi:MAG TPA: XdhC/CoxI family protein [Candidatus Cloacimonas sp.]|nr:XdhC/CoxI family protein [Candidatus Cloacimonas sp.]
MENSEYYGLIARHLTENTPLWQASVVESDGSTPARSGMKLAVGKPDILFGNLGGGEMEHKVIELIRESNYKTPVLISFDLSSGASVADRQTGMICGGQVKVFIEPLYQAETLYIIGAGHCGRALGQMARLTGFRVVLIDNRSEIILSDLSQYCHQAVLHDYADLGQIIDFSPQSWVVIMTHGHLHDKEVLEQCLRKPLCYLGMIGSKKKVAETFANMKQKGFSDLELSKCHAPIGLPIGSQTPYEIAVSILAELIGLRHQDRKQDS